MTSADVRILEREVRSLREENTALKALVERQKPHEINTYLKLCHEKMDTQVNMVAKYKQIAIDRDSLLAEVCQEIDLLHGQIKKGLKAFDDSLVTTKR